MRMMDTVKTMFATFERSDVPNARDEPSELSNSGGPVAAPAVPERMIFMAERFGVGKGQLLAEPCPAIDMARICAGCGVAETSERFRKRKVTDFIPASCPNAPRFMEMRFDRAML